MRYRLAILSALAFLSLMVGCAGSFFDSNPTPTTQPLTSSQNAAWQVQNQLTNAWDTAVLFHAIGIIPDKDWPAAQAAYTTAQVGINAALDAANNQSPTYASLLNDATKLVTAFKSTAKQT